MRDPLVEALTEVVEHVVQRGIAIRALGADTWIVALAPEDARATLDSSITEPDSGGESRVRNGW